MKQKQFKGMALLLAGMMFVASGCAYDPVLLSSNESGDSGNSHSEKVLLAVNQYCEDGYGTETTYEYNKKGQIVRETNHDVSSDSGMDQEAGDVIYEYEYDNAGRLIGKKWADGSGIDGEDAYKGGEALERRYDEAGMMTEESGIYMGEYWRERNCEYDSQGRVSKESWKIDYIGDGSDYDIEEYQHEYIEQKDGTVLDKRQRIMDGEVMEETEFWYDSSGRLIQGYDEYWAVPITYHYLDDPYFTLYTETEKTEADDEEVTTTNAEITDSAGKTIESAFISMDASLHYDEDGYLIKARSDYGYTEFVYGDPDTQKNSSDQDSSSGDESSVSDRTSSENNGKSSAADLSEQGTALFAKLEGRRFTFSSGVGGWATQIEMHKDGTFHGYYFDSELGDTGSSYPGGTIYESTFTGSFVYTGQQDEYTYSVNLQNVKTEQTAGTETIVSGERHIAEKPSGFETGKEFLIYAPGHPAGTLPAEFREWIEASAGSLIQNGSLIGWGLYNVDPQYVMYEDSEWSILDKTAGNSSSEADVSCEENETSGVEEYEDGIEKPIIYFYPEETTELTVKLGNQENLTCTYPPYIDGWDIIADPDGSLTDQKTGRKLYALYWEGINRRENGITDGFVVEGSRTIDFLEEKLAVLGLNERESEEFIVYWLPKLQRNPYNYIHFASMDEINDIMPLELSVEPDTLIRVLMQYKPLEHPIAVPHQTLEAKERNGFTVVEWGGSEITG